MKYLSANDTYAKANVHQGGPYVAKEVLRVVFPHLCHRAEHEANPDLFFDTIVDSHGDYTTNLRLAWYNSKRTGQPNGRDEARLTRWGRQTLQSCRPSPPVHWSSSHTTASVLAMPTDCASGSRAISTNTIASSIASGR
ncbi:MAG: hypothetical protein IPF87_08280 [Gemmatimonadetes bacterium]|nr:hypothetical protein [Gemmatimonadota bacterium]